jgi:hypothetical protein
MTGRTDTGKGAGMLSEELLKTITWERERQIAEAQRIRSARVLKDDERHGRSWIQHLWATPPRFGGRPHPGRTASESSL